jgi:hypothetical protein
MDLISIFALIILIISIGTLLVGVAAYVAFKIRQARGPLPVVHGHQHPVNELMFLKQYEPTVGVQAAKSPLTASDATVFSPSANTLKNSQRV